jgi:hypothetical protein
MTAFAPKTGLVIADGLSILAANGGMIGFLAKSPEEVDAWRATSAANGGTSCEEPPGLRDNGDVKFYLAYLRDLDGQQAVRPASPPIVTSNITINCSTNTKA